MEQLTTVVYFTIHVALFSEKYSNVNMQLPLSLRMPTSLCRYIMIPANRGKDRKEQGMALKGTGGSGELRN